MMVSRTGNDYSILLSILKHIPAEGAGRLSSAVELLAAGVQLCAWSLAMTVKCYGRGGSNVRASLTECEPRLAIQPNSLPL
jgi:hypothetical protein